MRQDRGETFIVDEVDGDIRRNPASQRSERTSTGTPRDGKTSRRGSGYTEYTDTPVKRPSHGLTGNFLEDNAMPHQTIRELNNNILKTDLNYSPHETVYDRPRERSHQRVSRNDQLPSDENQGLHVMDSNAYFTDKVALRHHKHEVSRNVPPENLSVSMETEAHYNDSLVVRPDSQVSSVPSYPTSSSDGVHYHQSTKGHWEVTNQQLVDHPDLMLEGNVRGNLYRDSPRIYRKGEHYLIENKHLSNVKHINVKKCNKTPVSKQNLSAEYRYPAVNDSSHDIIHNDDVRFSSNPKHMHDGIPQFSPVHQSADETFDQTCKKDSGISSFMEETQDSDTGLKILSVKNLKTFNESFNEKSVMNISINQSDLERKAEEENKEKVKHWLDGFQFKNDLKSSADLECDNSLSPGAGKRGNMPVYTETDDGHRPVVMNRRNKRHTSGQTETSDIACQTINPSPRHPKRSPRIRVSEHRAGIEAAAEKRRIMKVARSLNNTEILRRRSADIGAMMRNVYGSPMKHRQSANSLTRSCSTTTAKRQAEDLEHDIEWSADYSATPPKSRKMNEDSHQDSSRHWFDNGSASLDARPKSNKDRAVIEHIQRQSTPSGRGQTGRDHHRRSGSQNEYQNQATTRVTGDRMATNTTFSEEESYDQGHNYLRSTHKNYRHSDSHSSSQYNSSSRNNSFRNSYEQSDQQIKNVRDMPHSYQEITNLTDFDVPSQREDFPRYGLDLEEKRQSGMSKWCVGGKRSSIGPSNLSKQELDRDEQRTNIHIYDNPIMRDGNKETSKQYDPEPVYVGENFPGRNCVSPTQLRYEQIKIIQNEIEVIEQDRRQSASKSLRRHSDERRNRRQSHENYQNLPALCSKRQSHAQSHGHDMYRVDPHSGYSCQTSNEMREHGFMPPASGDERHRQHITDNHNVSEELYQAEKVVQSPRHIENRKDLNVDIPFSPSGSMAKLRLNTPKSKDGHNQRNDAMQLISRSSAQREINIDGSTDSFYDDEDPMSGLPRNISQNSHRYHRHNSGESHRSGRYSDKENDRTGFIHIDEIGSISGPVTVQRYRRSPQEFTSKQLSPRNQQDKVEGLSNRRASISPRNSNNTYTLSGPIMMGQDRLIDNKMENFEPLSSERYSNKLSHNRSDSMSVQRAASQRQRAASQRHGRSPNTSREMSSSVRSRDPMTNRAVEHTYADEITISTTDVSSDPIHYSDERIRLEGPMAPSNRLHEQYRPDSDLHPTLVRGEHQNQPYTVAQVRQMELINQKPAKPKIKKSLFVANRNVATPVNFSEFAQGISNNTIEDAAENQQASPAPRPMTSPPEGFKVPLSVKSPKYTATKTVNRLAPPGIRQTSLPQAGYGEVLSSTLREASRRHLSEIKNRTGNNFIHSTPMNPRAPLMLNETISTIQASDDPDIEEVILI